MTLAAAQSIVAGCLAAGRQAGLQPLAVALLDKRGVLMAFAAEEGIGLGRPALAIGKANAALQLGIGTRALAKRAKDLPVFFAAIGQTVNGGFVPNPGGVLIRDTGNCIIGAVGISGDIGTNDETAAISGIESIGLRADPGND